MSKNATKALLLVNLGSPDSTSVKDVRRYLNEFLMDGRVVDYPLLLRFLIMRCIVVPKRAPESAAAYRKIWQEDGSPLITLTKRLSTAVQRKASFPVIFSMRYQNPDPQTVIDELYHHHQQLKELFVLPLYPHYTMSSYDTAVEQIRKLYNRRGYPFSLKFLSPFYENTDYINALAESIKPYLEQDYDKILFSYHGIPERHLRKDEKRIARKQIIDYRLPDINYQKQCFETTRLVTAQLNIPADKFEVTFQSRLTSAGIEWIKPYTTVRMDELPKEGIKKLLVVCPAFINDCLETLEEIAMQEKEKFLNAGGESLTLIPCINDQDLFAETIVKWVENGQ